MSTSDTAKRRDTALRDDLFEALPARFKAPNTTPADNRFSSANQTRHCWSRYNEFLMCARDHGPKSEECAVRKHYYRVICPNEWTTKWDEQRAEGKFMGIQYDGDLQENDEDEEDE